LWGEEADMIAGIFPQALEMLKKHQDKLE